MRWLISLWNLPETIRTDFGNVIDDLVEKCAPDTFIKWARYAGNWEYREVECKIVDWRFVDDNKWLVCVDIKWPPLIGISRTYTVTFDKDFKEKLLKFGNMIVDE